MSMKHGIIGLVAAVGLAWGGQAQAGGVHFGVSLSNLTTAFRAQYRMPYRYGGVLVWSVSPRGPAARAGIKPGDVLLRLDRIYVYKPTDVIRIVQGHRPGDRMLVDLFRMGKYRSFTVAFAGRVAAPPANQGGSPGTDRIGALQRVIAELARQVTELHKEVARLRAQTESLRKRVRQLESRPASGQPAGINSPPPVLSR